MITTKRLLKIVEAGICRESESMSDKILQVCFLQAVMATSRGCINMWNILRIVVCGTCVHLIFFMCLEDVRGVDYIIKVNQVINFLAGAPRWVKGLQVPNRGHTIHKSKPVKVFFFRVF